MSAFLVATPAAIFAYDADHGNLSALALEGEKEWLSTFGNYFVALTESEEGNGDDNQPNQMGGPPVLRQNLTVCLTLPAVRLIGFSGQFSEVAYVTIAQDSIFVLSKGGANGQAVLFQLKAKPMQEQIQILLKKRMFEWAAEIAIRGGYGREATADIYRQHGDSLYEKRAYDSALAIYAKTVELALPLEPSYVIQKFLETNKIGLIAKYLQKLHEKGLAEKEHTALLLQCYTKLKDKESLEAFVRQDKLIYDSSTAISTLEDSGYPKLASDLALRSGCREEFVRIHLEHFDDTSQVISFISELPAAAAVPVLMTHGHTLARSDPDETMRIVKRVCGLGSNPMPDAAPVCEPFLPLFVDDAPRLLDFLRDCVKSKHLQSSWQSIFLILLELLLRQNFKLKQRAFEQEMMQLLKEHCTSPETCTSALILCRTYEFSEGFEWVCEKDNRFQLLMQHFIDQGDVANIIKTCEKFSGRDPGLWGQALHFLAAKGGEGEAIKVVLKNIEANDLVPPLIVLEALRTSKDVPISYVNQFVLNAFSKLKKSVEKSKQSVKEDEAAIASMREEVTLLQANDKPLIFQATRCFQCGLALELPSVHFFSGHSYHSYCIPQNGRDPKCSEEDDQKKNLLLTRKNAASNPDEFFKFLRDSPDGFAAVSDYFGRGLFTPETGVGEDFEEI